MSNDDELYTAGKAARYLGVSRQRIYELLQEGRMGRQIGGVWFFSQQELDAYRVQRDEVLKSETVVPGPVITE